MISIAFALGNSNALGGRSRSDTLFPSLSFSRPTHSLFIYRFYPFFYPYKSYSERRLRITRHSAPVYRTRQQHNADSRARLLGFSVGRVLHVLLGTPLYFDSFWQKLSENHEFFLEAFGGLKIWRVPVCAHY